MYKRSRSTLSLSYSIAKLLPSTIGLKRMTEMAYWYYRHWTEGRLVGNHYQFFFTSHFGLAPADYQGKRILDRGCGPRGSLEWADMAAERIGLDPLVNQYRKLGIDRHQMKYVSARAEQIPFDDGHFDFVSSFNSLDHVDDLEQSISEIKRVLKPGGRFLLITDIHEQPTITEPVAFSWDMVSLFAPTLLPSRERHYEGSMMYTSIRQNIPFDHSNPQKRYGILSVILQKHL